MRMGGMKALVLISFLFSLVLPINASASCLWNSSWSDATNITFNVSDGSSQTNYTMYVNVTKQASMRSDYGDIRFLNNCSSDAYELGYWMETNSSDFAYFAVLVETINSTGCMCYGNPTAINKSNITNAFLFGDDFDSLTIGDLNGQNGWSGSTNFDVTNEVAVSDSGSCVIASTSSEIYHQLPLNLTYARIWVDVRENTTTTPSEYICINSYANASTDGFCIITNSVNAFKYGFTGSQTALDTPTTEAIDNWYKVEMRLDDVNHKFVSIWINDSQKSTNDAGWTLGLSFDKIGLITGGGTAGQKKWVDNVRYAKYNLVEPTYAFGQPFISPFVVTMVNPVINNTLLGANVTYFVWNLTSNYNLTNCSFQINGINQTGIIASGNLSCSYNETGIIGNVTRCAIGLGYNSTTWVETNTLCIKSNEQQPDIIPPDLNWTLPTLTNGTTTNNAYIEWNFTAISEDVTQAELNINGTNYTLAVHEGRWAYSNRSASGNYTFCGIGFMRDAAGNWNETELRCISVAYSFPSPFNVSVSKTTVSSSHYYLNGLVNCMNETGTGLCGNVTAWLETNASGTWLPVGNSGNITVPSGWTSYYCEEMADAINFSNIQKYSGNPILVPNASNPLENKSIGIVSIIKDDDGYYYLTYIGYNGTGATPYGHIFIKKSHDGRTNWTSINESGILYSNASNAWEGSLQYGVGGISLSPVYINGTKWYILTYTGYDNTTLIGSIGMKKSLTISGNQNDWSYVQPNPYNAIINGTGDNFWNSKSITTPSHIIYDNDSQTYIIYVAASNASNINQVGCYYNTTANLSTWAECSNNPKIAQNLTDWWREVHVRHPDFTKFNSTTWVIAASGIGAILSIDGIGLWFATNITDNLTEFNGNPIISNHTGTDWDTIIYSSSLLAPDGVFEIYYTAANTSDISIKKVGLAKAPAKKCYPIWDVNIGGGTYYVRAMANSTGSLFNISEPLELLNMIQNITIFSPANTTYFVSGISVNWASTSATLNWSAYSINSGANQSFTDEWQNANYNISTGIGVAVWGDEISWDNQFIWFVDEDSNYIMKYYLNGTFISNFSTIAAEGEYTRGVTQNGTYIWAINRNALKVYQYEMNGTPTGFNFSLAAMADPDDLDTDGNYIYISDMYPRKVFKYAMNGSLISNFTPSELTTYGGSITVWDGYIWLAQNHQVYNDRIFKYYVNGTYTGQNFTYATAGTNQGGLKMIDTNGIDFWLTDNFDKNAYKFYYGNFRNAINKTVNFSDGANNLTICAIDSNGVLACNTTYFTLNLSVEISNVTITPDDNPITPNTVEVNPVEASNAVVTASFNVTVDGYNSSVCRLYNQSGTLVQINSSSYSSPYNATVNLVSCKFSVPYYYLPQNFVVNVNASNIYGNSAESNGTFEYLTLDAFILSTSSLNYSATPNSSQTESFNVTNTGNYPPTTEIKGSDLVNASYSIGVGNLSWGLNPTPSTPLTVVFASVGTLDIQGWQQIYAKVSVPEGTLPLAYTGNIYIQSI